MTNQKWRSEPTMSKSAWCGSVLKGDEETANVGIISLNSKASSPSVKKRCTLNVSLLSRFILFNVTKYQECSVIPLVKLGCVH